MPGYFNNDKITATDVYPGYIKLVNTVIFVAFKDAYDGRKFFNKYELDYFLDNSLWISRSNFNRKELIDMNKEYGSNMIKFLKYKLKKHETAQNSKKQRFTNIQSRIMC